MLLGSERASKTGRGVKEDSLSLSLVFPEDSHAVVFLISLRFLLKKVFCPHTYEIVSRKVLQEAPKYS